MKNLLIFPLMLIPLQGCQDDRPSGAKTEQKEFVANYDENKIPPYQLPELLRTEDGRTVSSVAMWQEERRPELLEIFTTQMFGSVPDQNKLDIRTETSTPAPALDGKALRQEVTIHFNEQPEGPKLHLLCYLPKGVSKAPAFIGLNFFGNHSIHPDPNITISTAWMRNSEVMATSENRATEASRAKRSSRWPVEMILAEGFALVTAYYGDIDPDFDDGFQNGIHPLFFASGQSAPGKEEWGSIAAWAWGLSRAMDYLQSHPQIDSKRVALLGHSRLGKAALWAGATDERFAMVISNNSGCGGAALSRRAFGETIGRINDSFPHWFCDQFKSYNEAEHTLPVDQHQLLALMAPRPLYVASAAEDRWADPRGEFLSARHASPVYQLYELEGLSTDTMPAVNEPVAATIGYHIRSGAHDLTTYDWQQYLAFAKRHFHR
ncbi:MAG: acetylxylan esterase [Bacteroidota bacterium]